jgi:NAD-dependent DNA ligase
MTLAEYIEQLEAHDWYYHMSDDPSVYDRGYNNQLALRMIAVNHEDPAYLKAFNEEQAKNPFSKQLTQKQESNENSKST